MLQGVMSQGWLTRRQSTACCEFEPKPALDDRKQLAGKLAILNS